MGWQNLLVALFSFLAALDQPAHNKLTRGRTQRSERLIPTQVIGGLESLRSDGNGNGHLAPYGQWVQFPHCPATSERLVAFYKHPALTTPMIGHFGELADDLAQCAKEATGIIRENYEYENEGTLSVRFLDDFSDEIESYSATCPYKLDIDTYKLNGRGPETPESRFGPDFVIGFSFKLPNFHFSKGIMIQAKKGQVTDFDRLRRQCNDMLEWTPDSFLYQFSKEKGGRSYRMFPSLQIAQTSGDGPTYSGQELEFDHAYESRSTLKFYRLFFEGYVGDHWIFKNLQFFPNPDKHTLTDRPVAPDGGVPQEEQGIGGANTLVISVTEPGEKVTFLSLMKILLMISSVQTQQVCLNNHLLKSRADYIVISPRNWWSLNKYDVHSPHKVNLHQPANSDRCLSCGTTTYRDYYVLLLELSERRAVSAVADSRSIRSTRLRLPPS